MKMLWNLVKLTQKYSISRKKWRNFPILKAHFDAIFNCSYLVKSWSFGNRRNFPGWRNFWRCNNRGLTVVEFPKLFSCHWCNHCGLFFYTAVNAFSSRVNNCASLSYLGIPNSNIVKYPGYTFALKFCVYKIIILVLTIDLIWRNTLSWTEFPTITCP